MVLPLAAAVQPSVAARTPRCGGDHPDPGVGCGDRETWARLPIADRTRSPRPSRPRWSLHPGLRDQPGVRGLSGAFPQIREWAVHLCGPPSTSGKNAPKFVVSQRSWARIASTAFGTMPPSSLEATTERGEIREDPTRAARSALARLEERRHDEESCPRGSGIQPTKPGTLT